jgi:hypothetical protein
MSQQSKQSLDIGSIRTNDINLNTTTITQATNITTAVTLSAPCGIIVTQSATAGTHGTHSFTVSHPSVTVDKIVLTNIIGYTGTGSPTVRLQTTQGSFDVTIANNHINSSLNAPLRIAYTIL